MKNKKEFLRRWQLWCRLFNPKVDLMSGAAPEVRMYTWSPCGPDSASLECTRALSGNIYIYSQMNKYQYHLEVYLKYPMQQIQKRIWDFGTIVLLVTIEAPTVEPPTVTTSHTGNSTRTLWIYYLTVSRGLFNRPSGCGKSSSLDPDVNPSYGGDPKAPWTPQSSSQSRTSHA